MPNYAYDVILSYTDWAESNGKRVRTVQRAYAGTPDQAGFNAKENLYEELGNDAEDIRIVSVKRVHKKKLAAKKR